MAGPSEVLENLTGITFQQMFWVAKKWHCTGCCLKHLLKIFSSDYILHHGLNQTDLSVCKKQPCKVLKRNRYTWYVFCTPFFKRRQLLRLPVCFPTDQAPSEKGSTVKGKNSFLLEKTPIDKEGRNHFENCLPCKCICSP